jgi:hypothetical protein
VPSVLPKIVASMARQAIESFDLATELDHPVESGRAREVTLRRFLHALLPPDFGIDTGFVIDAAGGISRQIDVVIYRKQRAPVLEIGGIKHFMIESVAAVFETKASVGSKAVLHSALDNIASVKTLDRTNEGRNTIVGTGQPVNTAEFPHQVWGGVVAGRSMQYVPCMDAIREWSKERDRAQWPNVYVDIKEFMIEYGTGGAPGAPTTLQSDPSGARGLVAMQSWEMESGLAEFGVELLNFLRVTPLIGFSPQGYFSSVKLPHQTWLEFDVDDGPG